MWLTRYRGIICEILCTNSTIFPQLFQVQTTIFPLSCPNNISQTCPTCQRERVLYIAHHMLYSNFIFHAITRQPWTGVRIVINWSDMGPTAHVMYWILMRLKLTVRRWVSNNHSAEKGKTDWWPRGLWDRYTSGNSCYSHG